jgi:hypothetical protein
VDPIQLLLGNRKPAAPVRKPVVTKKAAPVSPLQKLLNELSQGPKQRTDAEWSALLDPRVKPFTDAIDSSTLNARARSEYQFETAAQANKDLGQGFLGVLTGGKTGAEAEQYSKENFGGAYLGAQAMSMAADHLKELTSDWDEREWAISGEYLKAMQEVPGIREELRAQVEKADGDEYERKFKYTTLLLDETYRQSQLAEDKRVHSEQLKQSAAALGINAMDDAADNKTAAKNAATSAKNAATRATQAEIARLREERQGLKDKAQIRQNDERLRIAREKLALQRKQASGKGSSAQKNETKLALDLLDDPEIIGRVDPEFPEEGRKGKKTRDEARVYLTGKAEVAMPYRSKSYIAKWVARQLKALYPPAPRRSGP